MSKNNINNELLFLVFAQKIKAVTIDINAGLDLGPQWKYEYQIKPQADPAESPKYRTQRKSIVADMAAAAGSQIFDMLKNIQLEDNNPELVVEPKAQLDNSTTATSKKSHKHRKRDHKKSHKRDRDTERSSKTLKLTTTTEKPEESQERHKTKTTRHKTKTTRHRKSKKAKKLRKRKIKTTKSDSETSEESKPKEISKEKSKKEKHKKIKRKAKSIHVNKTTTPITTTTTKPTTTKKQITSLVPKNDVDIFVKPIRVKDDPTLTDHIQYIYKQSLKVFDEIKNKVDNYKLKKEIKFLARSYDEKYKEFVKENKYHLVKSRLGRKKVVLNAAETSNRILDRLVGYLKSKVEEKGLRSGFPNVFERALQKKTDLENKRMCKKFGLCRTGKGFRHFLIDALTTVLNADDGKLIQMNDAFTEVLKNRDFSNIMDGRTAKHFQRSIRDFENYNIDVLKPIFYIVRNVLVNIHEPLRVTSKDRSVNKTVAFIEILDVFEEKMPPDEANRLAWDDSLNALRSWSNNDRFDITEMIETFVDHVKKAMDRFDSRTTGKIERNMNILMS